MPALHDIVTKGSTDRSVVVHVMDATDGTPETGVVFNSPGIDLWYRREGGARVAITEASLASLATAHTDGGFVHIADGDYRLDLPDAAFAAGANYVDFGGTVTGMIVVGGRVRLVDFSLENAVRGTTGTAVPNVAAGASGGLLISGSNAGTTTLGALTISGATTYTGNVSMAAGLTITQSTTNGSAIVAAGNGTGAGILATGGATGAGMSLVGGATSGLGLAIDYTAPIGGAKQLGILESGTMQSGSTSTTAVLRAATSLADDVIIGATLAITAGTGAGQSRLITDWVSSSKTATVPSWTTTPNNTSVYEVYRTAADPS